MAVQDEIPKSRLTLTYKTEVDGEPAAVELPLRLLFMGDFSQGTSKDRQVDLEERRLRNLDGKNTAGVMKDMGMALKFAVANKIDPDKGEQLEVDIPITSMKSFSPEEVAKNIPKVKGLLLLKKLLLEAESNVSNTKGFRKLLGDLYSNEDAFKKVLGELKGYEGLTLPTGKAGAAGDAPAGS